MTMASTDLIIGRERARTKLLARAGLPSAPEGPPPGVRVLDIACSLAALVFFAPFLIVLVLLVWLGDGASPIFAQRRIGRGGRMFRCFKLRTMVPDAEARLEKLLARDPAAREEWARDQKLRRDPRITPIGRFLRTSSFDELPQLYNVLRGDMSIVGPRPIVDAEKVRYGRYIRDYCSVPPGITGLWQISGRNDVSYRRRVALDVTYARAKSLPLDLKIIVATIPAVLLRRGSY